MEDIANTNYRFDVVIMGGGIAGLACAHELSRYGKNVCIVEKNSVLGGQARSIKAGSQYSEICWHMFASGYERLFELMREIPYDDSPSSVYDNLVPLMRYVYCRDVHTVSNTTGRSFLHGPLTIWNNMRALNYNVTICDLCRMCSFKKHADAGKFLGSVYDDITWKRYCEEKFTSDLAHWLSRVPSIYLGMDYEKVSLAEIAKLVSDYFPDGRHKPKGEKYDFYALCGPILETLFKPWEKFLRKRGVAIFKSTEIVNLTMNRARTALSSIDAIIGGTNNYIYIAGTIFVNTMAPGTFAKLLPHMSLLRIQMRELCRTSDFLQCDIRFFFDCKDNNITTAYIWPDSPWCLMARSDHAFWSHYKGKKNIGNGLQLAVGIGIWNVPGYNGKTALQCTRHELAREVWRQIKQQFGNICMPEYNIFYSFAYNYHQGRLCSPDTKFSCNVGVDQLRPGPKDVYYYNLYHGGAYAKTAVSMHNMEGATESGISAARKIIYNEII